jgi:3-oxoacyl-[acyl-carrier protein] reductase
MDTGLKGRTVLITGASQRIGRLAAIAFAREGCNLAICTSTKMQELNQVADEVRALGAQVVAEKCDITDAERAASFMKSIRDQLGRVDVVINSAGYRCEGSLADTTFSDWNQNIAVNLTGPMLICRNVIPLMIERRWGRIVNLSGLASYLGTSPAKAMVKFGIVGFTRGLAREFGEYNITANCIAPGGGGRGTMPLRSAQSVRRFGKMEEFVSLLVYLASENAGFITGQSYLIEGGTYFQ